MEGYNIALKIGTKTLLGRTQDDLTIAAKTKESITKDDEGETQTAVTGHDVTFKASAFARFNPGTGTATQLDRDDMLELALKKGTDAVLSLVYEATGGDTYAGSAIITNFTESSDSENEATISVDFKITGTFAKQV